jgi:hypothetical protein
MKSYCLLAPVVLPITGIHPIIGEQQFDINDRLG